MKWFRVASAVCASLCATSLAFGDLPPDGSAIRTNQYAIDLYQGPVLASTRVIGLSGAFVAIAEGVEGSSMNPAAPAVRTPYSFDHFDYDIGIGLTFPSALQNSDFFNSGRRDTQLLKGKTFDFVFLNLALNLQFGNWGFTATSDLQHYALRRAADTDLDKQRDEFIAEIAVSHLQAAHAFSDGQLIWGLGLRSTALSIVNEAASTTQQDLFSTQGVGFETGLILRPNNQQFRVGAAFRSAVTTQATRDSGKILYQGDVLDELYLPDRVTLPWDLNVGIAWQLGPRLLNPRWIDPLEQLERVRRYLKWRERERARRRAHAYRNAERQGVHAVATRKAIDAELSAEATLDEAHEARAVQQVDRHLIERYRNQKRFHILITASALITGSAENAVGVESFLERTVQRSGEKFSYSPRIAVEMEPIPNWLRVRAGTYREPTRFTSNREGSRMHGTLGFEQKLFPWEVFGTFPSGTDWRVSASIDAARRYFGWSVAIGVWH